MPDSGFPKNTDCFLFFSKDCKTHSDKSGRMVKVPGNLKSTLACCRGHINSKKIWLKSQSVWGNVWGCLEQGFLPLHQETFYRLLHPCEFMPFPVLRRTGGKERIPYWWKETRLVASHHSRAGSMWTWRADVFCQWSQVFRVLAPCAPATGGTVFSFLSSFKGHDNHGGCLYSLRLRRGGYWFLSPAWWDWPGNAQGYQGCYYLGSSILKKARYSKSRVLWGKNSSAFWKHTAESPIPTGHSLKSFTLERNPQGKP